MWMEFYQKSRLVHLPAYALIEVAAQAAAVPAALVDLQARKDGERLKPAS